jgi:hypothetical protein
MRLNHADVIDGSRCPCGVVGLTFLILPSRATVRKVRVSRSGLERPAVDGDSPVGENMCSVVVGARVAAGP